MSKEVLQEALELLAVATFITPKLQAKRTDVINAGLQALAEQPTQQEPVDISQMAISHGFTWSGTFGVWKAKQHQIKAFFESARAVTSPPASKPWVGLTEDERNAIGRHHAYVDNIIRATEAKLREKNA